ncbi:MAG: hypothetical protein NC084_00070 [Bacteroides sp.]|nr:hypothetical protein [Eubacterium sp.]MCM1417298.1 hypothetical protein [Roseburia sp.]MCM1461082.1 hypothetical protein [Bacteroides sp.]
MGALLTMFADTATTTATFNVPSIADSVTSKMMEGVLTQITDLLPVVLPVMIGCLAFRKGLSFLQGLIRGL